MSVNNATGQNATPTLAQIHDIEAQLDSAQDLGSTIFHTRDFLTTFHHTGLFNQLEALENDYRLMRDFMLKGYQDDKRDELYRQLLCRLYRLLREIELEFRITYDTSFAPVAQRRMELNIDEIRSELEAFVSDVVMLSLEGETEQTEKRKTLYARHQQYVQKLFDGILLSGQWSHEFAQEMAQLLSSPTIDVTDAQVLVSAMMLSAMNIADPEKVLALISVYETARDEVLHQRAFVGWVFAIDHDVMPLFGQITAEINRLLDRMEVRQELLELQMQVVYCQNAERDNAKLQRDIMPTLLKNQNFEVTRFGIKEKEEDPMDDILHPDAADKKMEELEKNIRKMDDMRKQGVDIYFGGFSQMKRFSFFYTLCNWFLPFFPEHPQLQHIPSEVLKSGFLKQVLSKGQFCDSDKYSFALGISTVFNNLPTNIREMLVNGEASMMVIPEDDGTDNSSAAYIRRMYLQDLFRFFKLNDRRSAFHNPFDGTDGHLFMISDAFIDKLGHEAREMQRFLLKQKMFDSLEKLHDAYFDPANTDDLMMKASLHIHHGEYLNAQTTYAHVCELIPDNEQVLKGYAMSSFYAEDYHEAVEQYRALVSRYPEHRRYNLNLAISLINDDAIDEGVKLLYRLNYEHPTDLSIKRALAWGQLLQQNLLPAAKLYNEILSDKDRQAVDYLNAGYCSWFQGDVETAVMQMQEFVQLQKQADEKIQQYSYYNIFDKFCEDTVLLDKYGISEVDRKLMADLVAAL